MWRPRTKTAPDPVAPTQSPTAFEWPVSLEMTRLLGENRDELLSGSMELAKWQRVVLATNTKMSGGEAAETEAREMTAAWLRQREVGFVNLTQAALGPRELFRMGTARDPETLLTLGFDALNMHCRPDFAKQAVRLYGTPACRACWLRSAADAICLAGSHTPSDRAEYYQWTYERGRAVLDKHGRVVKVKRVPSETDDGWEASTCAHFDIDLQLLLERCAGEPVYAHELLSVTRGVGLAVRAVRVETLLATGINAQQLAHAGVLMNDVLAMNASAKQQLALGYVGLSAL